MHTQVMINETCKKLCCLQFIHLDKKDRPLIKTAISHTIEMLCIYLSTKIELTMYTSHKIIFELHFFISLCGPRVTSACHGLHIDIRGRLMGVPAFRHRGCGGLNTWSPVGTSV